MMADTDAVTAGALECRCRMQLDESAVQVQVKNSYCPAPQGRGATPYTVQYSGVPKSSTSYSENGVLKGFDSTNSTVRN